jgi:hypothetical protein
VGGQQLSVGTVVVPRMTILWRLSHLTQKKVIRKADIGFSCTIYRVHLPSVSCVLQSFRLEALDVKMRFVYTTKNLSTREREK